MSFIQMRTVPGLFVGRRTLVCAEATQAAPGSTAFRCGACESVILTARDREELLDIVVKCSCGEINQL